VAGLYGNASRGFRSTDGVLDDPTLVPVTAWAYETGIKLDTAGISASLAAFRMNVSNEQTFNPLTSGSFSVVRADDRDSSSISAPPSPESLR